jgi:hypothetical protein
MNTYRARVEIGPKQFRVKPEVTAGYNRTRALSIHRQRLNKQKFYLLLCV